MLRAFCRHHSPATSGIDGSADTGTNEAIRHHGAICCVFLPQLFAMSFYRSYLLCLFFFFKKKKYFLQLLLSAPFYHSYLLSLNLSCLVCLFFFLLQLFAASYIYIYTIAICYDNLLQLFVVTFYHSYWLCIFTTTICCAFLP